MIGKPRLVFDTSVFVSAVLFEGFVPDQAVRSALKDAHVLISTSILEEVRDVFSRRKFDRYISVEDRIDFLEELIERAVLIEIAASIQACRDPHDKFLELALSGNADALITGDQDLLALHPFRHIPILTPEQFLASKSAPL